MPSSKNYEHEIEEGRNIRTIICRYCNSTVLTPKTAEYDTTEVNEEKENNTETFFSYSLSFSKVSVAVARAKKTVFGKSR